MRTMRENDFEKNVQNRMDELQLYPSAEVWPEIERRIRKERKRRWFIFWFLFPALLTGAGATYFLTVANKKPVTSNQDQKQIERSPVEKNKENTLVNDQPEITIISKDSSAIKKEILYAPGTSKDTKQKNTENNK
ncbi:MAG TPA: hypothetical protein VK483_11645, partial [Chitinophagaceae bacterium]|nr:hypothetical protein [Chitinophagaceae bacterium]